MNINTIHIFIGALVLSTIHALMPDHWIPLVMISRTERWSHREASWITAFVAFPHIVSTILIGLATGIAGYKIAAYESLMRVAAPSILVTLGLIYVSLHFRTTTKPGYQNLIKTEMPSKRSKIAVAFPLATALFLSPCVTIGSYYFVAGTIGWSGIALVSVIYLAVTTSGMILMVNLGLKGLGRVRWQILERYEKLITGIVLMVFGILVYFMEF